jgi:hypothetical protein
MKDKNNPLPPPAIPELWTFQDVLKLVPDNWHKARIAIYDGLGRAYPVKRLTMVTNHTGEQLVILGPMNLRIQDWQVGDYHKNEPFV